MKNLKSFGQFLNEQTSTEGLSERAKPVKKRDWDKADDEQREEWLLQAFSDPDDATEFIEVDWKDLPPAATQNMVMEGTRAQVGIIDPTGRIRSVYLHSDGGPDSAGKVLKNNYSDTTKVIKLLDLGTMGISSLAPSMRGGKGHDFYNRKPGETVFYGRDRGETGRPMMTLGNEKKMKQFMGDALGDSDFLYLWDSRDGQWLVADARTKKLQPLK